MAENLRGYVLDNGFLVFGDGMIRLDDVMAVYDVSDIGINTLCIDGSILDFKRLSPDKERNYVSMLLDCEPGGPSFMAAEASTGCEQEDKPQFLIDTKQIGLLRNTYWMLRKRLFMDEVNPEMEKLCEYSCLNWSQLRGIFDGERRDL